MKIKINHTIFMISGLILLLIAANYWGIAQYVMPFSLRKALLILSGALPLVLPFRYKKSRIILPWLFCFMIVVLNRNQEFARGGYYSSLRLIAAYLFIFASIKSCEWIKEAPKIISIVGGVNVIATILFFFNNRLYRIFIGATYKQYQNGTQNGTYGYRAALADHYSQNGTYITIVLLTVWAAFFALQTVNNKQKISIRIKRKHNGLKNKKINRDFLLYGGIITGIALLLTSKRAHLLFGIVTLVVVYYVINPEKRFQKSFKLMIAVAVALVGLNFLMDFIPEIAQVFERFQTAGSDNASLLRILMWERAQKIFKQNPIIGIGWYGFRYKSGLSEATGATAGCHNIYLELLCENGFFGFLVFMFTMITSIIGTWKNINLVCDKKSTELNDVKAALAVSFAIQFFVLLYGMTGNPIYDSTFCFYAVAVAINISFSMNMRGKI